MKRLLLSKLTNKGGISMSKGKKKKNKSKEELNAMKDDKKYRQNRPPR
jgi:hypothetical protein